MNKLQTQRAVNAATAGVATIALVAFIISYSALQQTAATYGFNGWQSWLWPLLIDLPILVFAFTSLVIGWLTGHRSIFATSMIVLFSAATVLFNLAHAELHWLNYAVAVMPPLALIVSFEALRELIQIVATHAPAPMTHEAHEPVASPKRKAVAAPKPMPHEADKIPGHDAAPAHVAAEPPMLQPAHEAEPEGIADEAEGNEQLPSLDKPKEPREWDKLKTNEARWAYYKEHSAMNLTDIAIAAKLGVSRDTVGRLRRAFEGNKVVKKVRGTELITNGVQH